MRALVVAALLASAAAASAQAPCDRCDFVDDESRPASDVYFTVGVGPTWRRAFGEDFAAAALELEIGGVASTFSVAARFSTVFGATRFGLPYEMLTVGPAFGFRVSPRVRLSVDNSFGGMIINRVSATRATDANVTGVTLGLHVGASVDLVRTRRGGALFASARVGFDWIAYDTTLSVAASAALGYRY